MKLKKKIHKKIQNKKITIKRIGVKIEIKKLKYNNKFSL
jgi:hypothetical protein